MKKIASQLSMQQNHIKVLTFFPCTNARTHACTHTRDTHYTHMVHTTHTHGIHFTHMVHKLHTWYTLHAHIYHTDFAIIYVTSPCVVIVCVRACVCLCVCVCVHACVRACLPVNVMQAYCTLQW